MYTTHNQGIFNNYMAEAAVYVAEYPSEAEQKQYAFLGALATLFVTSILLIALSVS